MYKAPSADISKEVLSLISKIDCVNGYWNCTKKFFDTEKNLPVTSVIKNSILAVSTKLKYDKPVDMTGYTMALNWVFTDYQAIKISEMTIDKLFNMIENNPSDTPINKYTDSDVDEEENDFGSFFGGTDLFEDEETEKKEKELPDFTVEELCNWAVKEFKSKKLHPILITGIFTGEFLRRQAYPSANSRLSRILTLLLLLKSGYTYLLNFSLDSAIEQEYGLYETSYESAVNNSDFDINFWNIVLIKILEKQADYIYRTIEGYEPEQVSSQTQEECELCSLADDTDKGKEEECELCALADDIAKAKPHDIIKELPTLQTKIIKMFNKNERITISEVVKTTKANLNTVKKHLAALVEKNLIEKHGKTRGAWYTKSF